MTDQPSPSFPEACALIALLRRRAAPQPDPLDPALDPERLTPILEAYLRDLAARTAGVDPALVDPRRPLLALGFDSLTTIELQHAIETSLGVVVPLALVLDGASVSDLAAAIIAAGGDQSAPPDQSLAPPARAPLADATSALSYGQQALWFMHQLAPLSSAYIIANAVRIRGALDIPALQRAFQTLVDRHAVLRTVFTVAQGAPAQQIRQDAPAFFQRVNASGWSEAALTAHLNEAAWAPFDLERGPLLRVRLFTCSAQDHLLVLAIHHIASDFWSLGVLFRELGLIYAAERAQRSAPLAPLALEYADYVRWQRDMLAGPEGERLWSYWRRTLAGDLPVLQLPTDRPASASGRNRGAAHAFALDQACVQRLRALSAARGVTPYTTLAAVFALLLFRYTRQTDILIGFPTAGRGRAQLADLVGYFVNPVALRADLSGDPSFDALLERMRRTLADALAHQDFPFALLAERLQPDRDPNRPPLVQVMFVLQKARSGDERNLAAFALGAHGARMDLAGLPLTPAPLDPPDAQFDLTFTMAEVGDTVAASLHYNADRFDAATMMRLAGHFQAALRCAVEAPERRIADGSLLTAAERQQILVEWSEARPEGSSRQSAVGSQQSAVSSRQSAVGSQQSAGGSRQAAAGSPQSAVGRQRPEVGNQQSGVGTNATLHELIAAQAARAPDAVAASFGRATSDEVRGAGPELSEEPKDERFDSAFDVRPSSLVVQVTYGALDARANQLAHHLRARGAGPDRIVGVRLDRTIELIVALLGVLKAGAAYLPLDPSYPAERIRFMLEDSQARLLVTQDAGRRTNAARSADPNQAQNDKQEDETFVFGRSSRVDLTADWPAIARRPATPPQVRVRPDNLAYVIYTSGSTGTPKGVAATHANAARLFAATHAWFRFDQRDVWSCFHSVAFDFSVWEIWGSLLYGGRLVITPHAVSRAPDAFYRLAWAERVSVLNQTPSAFQQFSDADAAALKLALRLVIFGGEALNFASLRPWCERHGDQRPRLVNMYGITETTVHVSYRPITRADAQRAGGSAIGRPIPDLRAYVLDPSGRATPIGIPGELYVGGAGLTRGYLNRPDLTAARFTPNPFAQASGVRGLGSGVRGLGSDPEPRSLTPAPRLYRTGDLARYRPDGDIEYLGRIDGQIKLRGFRIELGEIAAALRGHPAVRDAVAALREDGPGGPRIVAYVVQGSEVRGQGSADTASEILIPDPRSLIPDLREWLRARLPSHMLPAAFVFLDALPLTPNGKLDRRALPAPDARRFADVAYVAPRTPVEDLVAQIWAAVLGSERVGIHDDFFAQGGHSLLATQLISRVREVFGVDLPLRSLFETPTVAGLSERIIGLQRRVAGPPAPPLAPIAHDRALPLSYPQQRLWFLNQLQPDSPAYNVPMAVRLVGRLDLRALDRSLYAIVRRHASLRTTFVIAGGQPAQLIAANIRLPIQIYDLRALAGPARTAALQRILRAAAAQLFDLARGPLLRVAAARLAPHEHVLLVTMHHIVADGWSVGVLIRELAALYAAQTGGGAADLPDLPIQYPDYAVWQRQWLQGARLNDQMSYWRGQLADLSALQLPADHRRPAITTFRGATHTFTLTNTLMGALDALAQERGVTLFMALLAAWYVLLARYSGQTDLVVGTTIANRTRSEVEPLIGCFMNTLALRADLSGRPSFAELLGRVREICLDAYTHQDLPFEQLVDALRPTRDLSRQPLFQVTFELQNAADGALDLPGLDAHPIDVDPGGAKFDLSLTFAHAAGALAGTLWYAADLFEPATIARMADHYQTLLAGAVADPARRIALLPLLTDAERRELIVERNHTRAAYPSERCYHELFEAQVARTPDAIAAVFGARHLSYAALDRRANQLAQLLRALGVGPGTRTGICMARSLDLVIGLLGIFKAGSAFLPLDPSFPRERMAFMLADGAARVIVTSDAGRRPNDPGVDWSFAAGQASVVNLSAERAAIDRQPAQRPESGATGAHLAYLIYTSGSTGRPKGVLISHQGLVNYVIWCLEAYTVAQGRGAPVHASIAADAIFPSLFAPLLVGASVVILPETQALDALGAALCEVGGFSMIKITPSQLELLNHILPTAGARGWVRTLVVGAEPLRGEVLQFWQTHAPDTTLLNEYGPTETVVGCSIYRVTSAIAGATPIGLPIANTQFYVLDAQMQPTPIGVAGELYIGGDGVAWGYLGRPDLTAERFVPNPFAVTTTVETQDIASLPHTRLYKTGDLVRVLADRSANLVFLGRIDDQVKIRGYRVEPGEVEAALGRHPAVRECVVVARADGPDRKRLVAYVVPSAELRPPGDGHTPLAPELWPSIGEYLLYDELIYHVLTNDERRQRVYRSALERTVRGRVVVDIGAGADAILARMCVEAGAQKVYAIEMLREAYEAACRLVEQLRLADKISVIYGESTQVSLPEAADVCVSQIIGVIGGAEGAAAIINDARRFLKPDGLMIPQRSVTKIAAICLPDAIAQRPHLATVPRYYAEKTFEKVGQRFDLRLCIKNFPAANRISDVGIFEDLDFATHTQPEYQREIRLVITRRSRLDGFLVWLNLHVAPDAQLDVLEDEYAWLPVFFPVFYPGVEVDEGDVVTAVCRATLSGNRINPDYAVSGTLQRAGAPAIAFSYQSSYAGVEYKSSPFYRALFDAEGAPPRADDRARELIADLREYLKQRLPDYMIPSAFVALDALPLAPHGKIDRRRLPEPDSARPDLPAAYAQPRTAIQDQVAEVWAQTLRIDQVGIHDNFFALGGDSILGIEVIDRLSRIGWRLTPRQIFQHQTIAELAQALEPLRAIQAEQGPSVGRAPLTPIQRWFFEQDFADPHHYNQALLLEARRPLDPALLRRALARLLQRHDALRLRFTRDAGGWSQSYAAPRDPPAFTRIDLSALADPGRAAALATAARGAQASLRLDHGPLVRAAYFACGPERAARVLLVIHHLVVDGVSWRVLIDDLQAAYEQLEGGAPLRLPPKTTAFQQWAERLAAYAQPEALRADQQYWLSRPWDLARPLPRDFAGGGNAAAAARTASVWLSAAETQALSHARAEADRAQINDLLLTALALAFARWDGRPALLVDLEGHGREDLFADVDLSRTVGWFTTLFPVVLDLEGIDRPDAALRAIKRQLGAIPQRGLSYGALRYLSGSAPIAAQLRALPQAEVSFNYLGQLDQPLAAARLFRLAPESSGAAQSPRAGRRYLLEIQGVIVEGRLRMDWIYSEQIHRRATIERLADAYLAALHDLLAGGSAGGYAPDDFPLAQVSQDELDAAFDQVTFDEG